MVMIEVRGATYRIGGYCRVLLFKVMRKYFDKTVQELIGGRGDDFNLQKGI
jgi:hypothetical protein